MSTKPSRIAHLRDRSDSRPSPNHLRKHLHLTNYISLKQCHPHNMKKPEVDSNDPELSLIKELSTLKKSKPLRDPPTSPSWRRVVLPQHHIHRYHHRSFGRTNESSSNAGVHVKDSFRGNCTALGGSDESSDLEGFVEIRLGDGKQVGTSSVKRSSTGSVHGRSDISALNNLESVRTPHLLNAIREVNSRKQECCGGLLTKSRVQGLLRKDRRLSRRGEHGMESTRERKSSCSSDATNKTRFRTRSTRKLRTKRIRNFSKSSPCFTCRRNSLSRKSLELLDRVNASDHERASELLQNRCGAPWNWSRVHAKGKNVLDMPGHFGGASGRFANMGRITPSRVHPSSSDVSSSSESLNTDTTLNTDSESLPLLEPGLPSDSGNPTEVVFGEETDQDKSYRSRRDVGEFSFVNLVANSQSLSQKYMPRSFQDIVGQSLITQSLSNALSKGRIIPAYIFYGPRGVGKTSCARVFALALNCTSANESRPCGSCSECLAYVSGNASIFKEFTAGALQGSRGTKEFVQEIERSRCSQYTVLMIDECHMLSNQAWNVFVKVAETAPRNIVFILSTTSLDKLPHAVTSKCQKFNFLKIKESEVMKRLQLIAQHEGLEFEEGALKLIASSCDGSLRDAEMMLDQLSLLGQQISLSMAQELMGLVPDERLIDLLDFALSADTVNTVRNIKELMTSGVEPLNLMSQLACIITSILSGNYQIPKGNRRRKFFGRDHLEKGDMERLRQALKTLSEAEKQLRGSADQTTWLTAALLQFAPDQSYMLPTSSPNTSLTQSPGVFNSVSGTAEQKCLFFPTRRSFEAGSKTGTQSYSSDSRSLARRSRARSHSRRISTNHSVHANRSANWHTTLTSDFELEDVWQRVLDAVHSSSLRKFLQTQGKLLSLSLSKGFAVAILQFGQFESCSRAERSKTSIAHAFQVTLGNPVEVRVQLSSTMESHTFRPPSRAGSGGSRACQQYRQGTSHHIIEKGPMQSYHREVDFRDMEEKLERSWLEGPHADDVYIGSSSGTGRHNESDVLYKTNRKHRGRLSLGFVIQQPEMNPNGYSPDVEVGSMNGTSNQTFNEIHASVTGGANEHEHAAKLEEENMRLESRSARFLCWKALDVQHDSVEHPQHRQRRSGFLLTLCPCAKSENR